MDEQRDVYSGNYGEGYSLDNTSGTGGGGGGGAGEGGGGGAGDGGGGGGAGGGGSSRGGGNDGGSEVEAQEEGMNSLSTLLHPLALRL